MTDFTPDLSKASQRIKNTASHPPSVGHGGVSGETIFTIIRNDRRRALLYELASRPEETIDASTAADALAEYECGPGYTRAERKAVYVNLVQTHIPLLQKHDVIECERTTGALEFGQNAVPILETYYRNTVTEDPARRAEQAAPIS